MGLIKMEDVAPIVECRRDQTLATQDACRAESLVEKVQVSHAVQERQDHGLWSYRCGERIDGGVEVVGFATEEDEIEVAT